MTSLLCSSSFCLFFASTLSAATFTWDGGAGTNHWTDNNNWNPNGDPSPSDQVYIGLGATVLVNQSVRDIRSGGLISLTNNAFLDYGLFFADLYVLDGSFNISGGADFLMENSYLDGVVIGNFRYPNQSGLFTITGVGSSATVRDLALDEQSLVSVENGAELMVTSSTDIGRFGSSNTVMRVEDSGTVVDLNFTTLGGSTSGLLEILSGAEVTSNFMTVGNFSGSYGELIVDGSGSSFSSLNSIVVGNSGTGILTVRNGGLISSDLDFVVETSGSQIQVESAGLLKGEKLILSYASNFNMTGGRAELEAIEHGETQGSISQSGGTLAWNRTSSDYGTFQITATETLSGTFNQGSNAVWEVKVNGLDQGDDNGDDVGYDHYSINNPIILNGTLRMIFEDGFVPSSGNTFYPVSSENVLITSDISLGGSFAFESNYSLQSNEFWTVEVVNIQGEEKLRVSLNTDLEYSANEPFDYVAGNLGTSANGGTGWSTRWGLVPSTSSVSGTPLSTVGIGSLTAPLDYGLTSTGAHLADIVSGSSGTVGATRKLSSSVDMGIDGEYWFTFLYNQTGPGPYGVLGMAFLDTGAGTNRVFEVSTKSSAWRIKEGSSSIGTGTAPTFAAGTDNLLIVKIESSTLNDDIIKIYNVPSSGAIGGSLPQFEYTASLDCSANIGWLQLLGSNNLDRIDEISFGEYYSDVTEVISNFVVECFDYPSGALGTNANGGKGWSTAWGLTGSSGGSVSGTPASIIGSGSLTPPSDYLRTLSDGHISDIGSGSGGVISATRGLDSPIDMGENGEYWFSFLYNQSGAGPFGVLGLVFLDTVTGTNKVFEVSTKSSAWRIREGAASIGTGTAPTFISGTDNLFLCKVSTSKDNDDIISIYSVPSSGLIGGEPTFLYSGTIDSDASLGWIQLLGSNNLDRMDEIVVGLSFRSVIEAD